MSFTDEGKNYLSQEKLSEAQNSRCDVWGIFFCI